MSNLYIRVRTGFYTHRKTMKLSLLIGDDAFWVPPRLWAYAAENQSDGNMANYSSEELSMLLGCSKHATSLLQALKESGFIDQDGMIHGWSEHNGYHSTFKARASEAAKAMWAKKKEAKKKGEDIDIDIETSIASSMLQACSKQIGAWFRRREGTQWSENELRKLKAVIALNTPKEDMELLERYYTASIPEDRDYRRHDIVTLLNNWNGEIDRAREFFKASVSPKQKQLFIP